MPRHARFHQDWNIYHVMIRCNNKQMLLRNKSTKMLLLESFGRFQQRLGFKLYAFVIMDNHAHWLIKVSGINGLSVVMQKVLLSFSRMYRSDQPYVGHFWQGRYKSVSVGTDIAMKELLRYVHDNPVKAKIVGKAQDYVYSSAYKYLDGCQNDEIEGIITITRYGDTSGVSEELIKL